MHRIYIVTTAIPAAIAALIIVAFCFVIDPYELFPAVGGYSPQKKVDLFYHLRLHKPYAMEKVQADHLIVGSSRSARLPPAALAGPAQTASLRSSHADRWARGCSRPRHETRS